MWGWIAVTYSASGNNDGNWEEMTDCRSNQQQQGKLKCYLLLAFSSIGLKFFPQYGILPDQRDLAGCIWGCFPFYFLWLSF